MRRHVLGHSVGGGQQTRAVRQRGLVRVVAALLVLVSTLVVAIRPAQAANPFVDVLPSDPTYTAIDALYNMNIIKGYQTNPPTFGPADKSLRAQMAALIGRAMAWDTGGTNPFNDKWVLPLDMVDNSNSAWRLRNPQFRGRGTPTG